MDTEKAIAVPAADDAPARSPRTHIDSQPLPTDSMVTVPLSESGTDEGLVGEEDEDAAPMMQQPEVRVGDKRLSSRPTSAEILSAIREPRSSAGSIQTAAMASPTASSPRGGEDEGPQTPGSEARSRSDSSGSDGSAQVDWAELEKKEEQVPQEDGQDEVS